MVSGKKRNDHEENSNDHIYVVNYNFEPGFPLGGRNAVTEIG